MKTINKKRFYLYQSWQETIKLLSIEEQATMLMNFFKYANNEEVTLNTPALQIAWSGFSFLLENDNIKYQEAVERGQKAGQSKKSVPVLNEPVPVKNKPEPVKDEPAPVLNEPAPVEKNRYVHDNVNDNVNVNVNDNENGDENEDDDENEDNPNVEWFLNKLRNQGNYIELSKKYPKSSSLSEAMDIYWED